MTRTCERCSEPIPQGKRADAKYCSDKCGNRTRYKRYYDTHPDELAAKRLKDNSDKAKAMYHRIKSRAKRDGIDFNIDVEDIVIPTHCPVLGVELCLYNKGRRGYFPDSPSLDRMVPSLGYIKGNVQVMSARANLLKNDATVDELQQVINYMKGN